MKNKKQKMLLFSLISIVFLGLFTGSGQCVSTLKEN